MTDSVLDEAYGRVRHIGPERDGWLSNHAPMAVEVLVRRGQARGVHRWLDSYADRLEERPRGIRPIPVARHRRGRDPRRDPARSRLRALLDYETGPRIAELGQGLAY